MDPYSSPYIIPSHSLHNPFPHSLLPARESVESLKCRLTTGAPAGTKQAAVRIVLGARTTSRGMTSRRRFTSFGVLLSEVEARACRCGCRNYGPFLGP